MSSNHGILTRDIIGCNYFVRNTLVLDCDKNLKNIRTAKIKQLTVKDVEVNGNLLVQGVPITGGSGGGGLFDIRITNVPQSSPNTIVDISSTDLTVSQYELVYINRGIVKYYSDQTPQLLAPQHNLLTPLNQVSFTNFDIQNGDVIVYEIYDGTNTTTSRMLARTAKKYVSICFTNNSIPVVYDSNTDNYAFPFRPLSIYTFGDQIISTGTDAADVINTFFPPGFLFQSSSGCFIALVETFSDATSYGDIPVFHLGSFVIGYKNTSSVNLDMLIDNTACTINWGDGTTSNFPQTSSHAYDTTQQWYIEIMGYGTSNVDLYFKDMSSINQWGGVTLFQNSLSYCEELEYIITYDTPTFDGTSFNSIFTDCYLLRKISIPWDVSTITDFSYMFGFCYLLDEITGLETWNISNVTSLQGMFYRCRSLIVQSISGLSTWDPSNVTNMESTFEQCLSLTSVSPISNWNVSSVETMRYMFGQCPVLVDVTLNWNTSALTNVSFMFSDCNTLPTVTFGPNWNTSLVTNMSYMFVNCFLLSSLDVSTWNTSNVERMDFMFAMATWWQPSTYKFNNVLTTLNVTNWDVSKVGTGSTFFSFFGMESMFAGCTNLINVDVSNWNTANLGSMGACFWKTKVNPNITGWTLSNLGAGASGVDGRQNAASTCFDDMPNFSQANYDTALINFANNAPQLVPPGFGLTTVWANVNAHFTAPPSAAATARDTLINVRGWQITDLGPI